MEKSRIELSEPVWVKPMTHLAKELWTSWMKITILILKKRSLMSVKCDDMLIIS